MNSLSQSLHAIGRRMTPQRALVLRILDETQEHLDAETIWKRAKAQDQTINLATVYRTLAVLDELGMVDQRYFARDHKREVYEPTNRAEHYHFTCLECGKVIEFQTSGILQAMSDLREITGANPNHACVCFEGYCSDCTEKQSNRMEKI